MERLHQVTQAEGVLCAVHANDNASNNSWQGGGLSVNIRRWEAAARTLLLATLSNSTGQGLAGRMAGSTQAAGMFGAMKRRAGYCPGPDLQVDKLPSHMPCWQAAAGILSGLSCKQGRRGLLQVYGLSALWIQQWGPAAGNVR